MLLDDATCLLLGIPTDKTLREMLHAAVSASETGVTARDMSKTYPHVEPIRWMRAAHSLSKLGKLRYSWRPHKKEDGPIQEALYERPSSSSLL